MGATVYFPERVIVDDDNKAIPFGWAEEDSIYVVDIGASRAQVRGPRARKS